MKLASSVWVVFFLAILNSHLVAEQNMEDQETRQGLVFLSSETQWIDAPAYPGAKMTIVEGTPSKSGPFTVRFKFPPNSHIPPHFHPGDERDTVIAGSLHVAMSEHFDFSDVRTLLAGDFWFIPAGLAHTAWTTEETVLQIQGMGPWGITFLNNCNCFFK